MTRLSTFREYRNLIWSKREHQQHSNWYAITAQTDGPTKVDIYDEIGFFGTSASDFVGELRNLTGDLEIHLNSPGGEVMDGLTIYNNLRQHDSGIVSVVIDGMAGSIASVIAQAADPGHLEIHEHAQMMIHNASGLCIGTAADMRELADLLDRQTANIADIYAGRSGNSVDEMLGLMASETWYIGQEAVDANLADSIIEDSYPAPNKGKKPKNQSKGPVEKHQSGPPQNDAEESFNFDSVRAALKELVV
jgi:ATP-dependent protease ClpP protease subunit